MYAHPYKIIHSLTNGYNYLSSYVFILLCRFLFGTIKENNVKIIKKAALAALMTISCMGAANAAAEFYSGTVTRVALLGTDGSFIVTLNNSSLDDCQHRYAFIYAEDLGEIKVDRAYQMALTSITTGVEMGVVIDKDTNGAGGQCRAIGMTADLRASW